MYSAGEYQPGFDSQVFGQAAYLPLLIARTATLPPLSTVTELASQ